MSDEKTYEKIRITEKDQVEWLEKSYNLSSNLKRKNVTTENKNNCFRFNLKKATNLGGLYLIPKIFGLKGICNVPGRPVFFNYRDPLLKKFKNSWITIYSL